MVIGEVAGTRARPVLPIGYRRVAEPGPATTRRTSWPRSSTLSRSRQAWASIAACTVTWSNDQGWERMWARSRCAQPFSPARKALRAAVRSSLILRRIGSGDRRLISSNLPHRSGTTLGSARRRWSKDRGASPPDERRRLRTGHGGLPARRRPDRNREGTRDGWTHSPESWPRFRQAPPDSAGRRSTRPAVDDGSHPPTPSRCAPAHPDQLVEQPWRHSTAITELCATTLS